jgi:hypothetical protein
MESGTCTSSGYRDAACLSFIGYSAYAPHGSLSLNDACGNGTDVPSSDKSRRTQSAAKEDTDPGTIVSKSSILVQIQRREIRL